MHRVVLEPENFAEAAQILLDLADDRREVRTTTDTGRLGLVIPAALHERYLTYLAQQETPAPSTGSGRKGSKK